VIHRWPQTRKSPSAMTLAIFAAPLVRFRRKRRGIEKFYTLLYCKKTPMSTDYLYKDLTYQIIGCLYEVHREGVDFICR